MGSVRAWWIWMPLFVADVGGRAVDGVAMMLFEWAKSRRDAARRPVLGLLEGEDGRDGDIQAKMDSSVLELVIASWSRWKALGPSP